MTGPEKVWLFKSIDIPMLFPSLNKRKELQTLWKTFFRLIIDVNDPEYNFDCSAKKWVSDFTDIYPAKEVTPYMHAFSMHVSQFMHLHGNVRMLNQQGLEKLNDVCTIHFQQSSNHRDIQALKQILEKRNRIEQLEDSGYQKQKKEQECSVCKTMGHNKRSCPKQSQPAQ